MKSNFTDLQLHKTSRDIRKKILEMIVPLESHHIGCALGIVEILTVLYFSEMKHTPQNPQSIDRDYFILSKGHSASALYATLCTAGYFDESLLQTYDSNGSNMPEHASHHVPGVEYSTGSLGHGLPAGCGVAYSFKKIDKKQNKVYVMVSDGEFNEGSNWEAIQFAGHHELNNLVVIADVNGFQGYSSTQNVIDLSPLDTKIREFKWNVYSANGNNIESLLMVFKQLRRTNNNKPHVILCNTTKGKGMGSFEGTFESHYTSLTLDQKKQILSHL